MSRPTSEPSSLPHTTPRFQQAAASRKLPRMTASPLPFAIARMNRPIEGDFDTLVPWWSITKSVLAAAVLKLVEAGKIDLEEFYEDWPFTIRQLLQHRSGLNTYGGPTYRQAVENGEPVWSHAELLARRNARQLLFRPGEGWAYSNIGYLFVRLLIERTTTAGLGEALKDLVFEPMAIASTYLAKTPEDMAGTLWGKRDDYDPRWVYHGLLIGPPSDAVRFLRGLLDSDFLTPASRSAMLDRHELGGALPDRPWRKTGYGLGLMIGEMKDAGRVIGHSGVGPDTVSALYAFPDLPDEPVVGVFAQAPQEGLVEHEAVRLALKG